MLLGLKVMSDDMVNNEPHEEPADAPKISLGGSDAVNLAAEQWKETAHRNIPGLGDLPIPDDTANLREGPSLHDGLLALLPLVGVWRGTGQALDHTDADAKPTQFGQQIIFAHDGENYLTYSSRVWKLDDEGNQVGLDHRETGFWRITGKDEIEVVVAHSTGVVEIFYGNQGTGVGNHVGINVGDHNRAKEFGCGQTPVWPDAE